MLVAIGLLILAVLLFGSSRVIGAIGAVLGIIAACAGLAALAMYFDSDPATVLAWVVGVPVAVICALAAYGFLTQKR